MVYCKYPHCFWYARECYSFVPDSWEVGETLFVEWQVINDPLIIKN